MKFEDILSCMSNSDYIEVIDYSNLETVYYGRISDIPDVYDNANIALITASRKALKVFNLYNAIVVIYIDTE